MRRSGHHRRRDGRGKDSTHRNAVQTVELFSDQELQPLQEQTHGQNQGAPGKYVKEFANMAN